MAIPGRTRTRLAVTLGVLALLVSSAGGAAARESRPTAPTWGPADVGSSDRLIVRFSPSVKAAARGAIASRHGLRFVDRIRTAGIDVVEAAPGKADRARAALLREPGVVDVATDDELFLVGDPTAEPGFGLQWGLHNTGQNINGYDGVPDADIDGLEALAITTGDPSIVVAVIDNGVDLSHPDLASAAWTNPAETANGIDDDGNGIVDDIHGVNYCATPATGIVYASGEWHGTHVAGTIAAAIDGAGVVGVAPGVKIMALRFICGQTGSTSNAIKAIEYAKAHGVRISNNSWGGSSYNSALESTIANSGMLFVAAAGNGGGDGVGDNNDQTPSYPASYSAANVLSVAAVHNEAELSRFSNYGKVSVDISAPGEDILSTLPGDLDVDCPAPCYGWSNGTSMAAPHVTGVAALAASVKPSLLADPVALKKRVLDTGKPVAATAGRTLTGKMVDAWRAVDTTPPASPGPTSHSFVSGSAIGSTIKTRVAWPAGSDDLSGVAAYGVRQAVNGGAWSWITTATTARSLDRSLTFTSSYRFQVRARDRAANYGAFVDGPLVKPALYQQWSSALTYGGTWRTTTSSSASGGSTKYATKAGSWVQFRFTGRAVAVVAPRSSSRGSIKVYVDGSYVSTVSTYRSSGQSRIVVFSKAWSASGAHTIKLVVVGTSGHPRFDIDAFAKLN
jgi:subtilisin family serine protease